MTTAAERLSDALIEHQIDLEQFKAGTQRKINRLLRRADRQLIRALIEALDNYGETGSQAAARKRKSLARLLKRITKLRREQWGPIEAAIVTDMRQLGGFENGWQAEALEQAVALQDFDAAALTAGAVTAAVMLPFQGRTIRGHIADTRQRDIRNLTLAVQIGVLEGQTAAEIVRTIRGTPAVRFSDGVLRQTHNMTNTVISTSVNGVTSNVRTAVWRQNSIVVGMVWRSILDGVTTAICRARSGTGYPFPGAEARFPDSIEPLTPPSARPPAHYNCRSHLEAVLDPAAAIPRNQITVTTLLSTPARQRNFRRMARATAGARWSRMTDRQRRRAIKAEQRQFYADHIGSVASEVNYEDWLRTRSAAFQDGVLGKAKGRLFREGGLSLDRFVNLSGKELTLEQLRQRYPSAFARAGL